MKTENYYTAKAEIEKIDKQGAFMIKSEILLVLVRACFGKIGKLKAYKE